MKRMKTKVKRVMVVETNKPMERMMMTLATRAKTRTIANRTNQVYHPKNLLTQEDALAECHLARTIKVNTKIRMTGQTVSSTML